MPSSKLRLCLSFGLFTLGLVAACGGTAVIEQGGAGGGAGTPVPCGAVTCSPGDLCLWPPETCDYSTQPPQVVRDDKLCVAQPAACAGQSGQALETCLEQQLCSDAATPELTTYEDGLLSCGPAWLDCF